MRKYKTFIKQDGDDYLVGAFSPGVPGEQYSRYDGPTARVSATKDWLSICTDDYEGHAMLNIETLPKLRLALARLAKQLKTNPPKT